MLLSMSSLNDTKFEDLIDIAETFPQFRELIRQHAISKYHINTKWIRYYGTNMIDSSIYSDDNSDSIRIYDNTTSTTTLPRFLQHFGQLISRIEISNRKYDSGSSTKSISDAINKYCSESLKEMTLWYDSDWDALAQKPFKQLTNLLLLSFSWNCENNIKNLTELFPSLENVAFEHYGSDVSLLKCFKQHFPHLEYVRLPYYIKRKPNNSIDTFDQFMELNPQIRGVHMKETVFDSDILDLLRLTSEKLPNLEILGIQTNLDVYPISLTDDNPIVFGKLKELEIYGSHSWMNFIIRNHELRVLNITWMMNLNGWTTIVENLPNLVEIQVTWRPHDSNQQNGIISLMSRETNLKKVTFRFGYSRQEYNILRGLLHPKWQFEGQVEDHMPNITFIRSNQTLIDLI